MSMMPYPSNEAVAQAPVQRVQSTVVLWLRCVVDIVFIFRGAVWVVPHIHRHLCKSNAPWSADNSRNARFRRHGRSCDYPYTSNVSIYYESVDTQVHICMQQCHFGFMYWYFAIESLQLQSCAPNAVQPPGMHLRDFASV